MNLDGSFSHDRCQDLCQNLGGKLPEPRNEIENNFLDSLDICNFVLGINDKEVEGQWVFDSDNTKVTWFDWEIYGGIPNGGTTQNCAFMHHNWADYKCESTSFYDVQKRQLVCERVGTQGNR